MRQPRPVQKNIGVASGAQTAPGHPAPDYAALDKEHLWHPFTQMQAWQQEEPLIVEWAEGEYLYDIQGRRYIDGHSSLWVNVHGHAHPKIVEAVQRQVERLDHSTLLGLSNVPSIEFAVRLKRHLPSHLTRIFYSDSGATSVEIALKMAFQYWQLRGIAGKTRFVCFDEAYHGDTIGSVSVGGIDLFHNIFKPLLFNAVRTPFPYPYRDKVAPDDGQKVAQRCLDALERTLKSEGVTLAALVAEPGIQGASGMHMAPIGFMKEVEHLCHKHDVLLILDEVATGFGRTGKMFARDHDGCDPDLMCLAKGITGGVLPLAVTAATERIYEAFLAPYADMKAFFHGHSYTGNPIACAAALASLDIFENDRVIELLQPKVRLLERQLAALASHRHVGEIRQRGMMVGIELVADRQTREMWPTEAMVPWKVVMAARRYGAVIRPLGNVMVLMPPLGISEATLTELIQITALAVEEGTA